jgi:hypothetical protein
MRALLKLIALSFFAAFMVLPAASGEDSVGKFIGNIVASLLPDGRNMKLEQSFSFIDAKGKRWEVPAGIETDGASIPQIFWITHPPFTGKYRYAAVIHDHYCRTKERSWQETHNVFYDAMRAAGVEERTAKLLWAAVYRMGPRWGGAGFTTRSAHPTPPPPPLEKQSEFMNELDAWMARDNPSRDQIAKAMELGRIPK